MNGGGNSIKDGGYSGIGTGIRELPSTTQEGIHAINRITMCILIKVGINTSPELVHAYIVRCPVRTRDLQISMNELSYGVTIYPPTQGGTVEAACGDVHPTSRVVIESSKLEIRTYVFKNFRNSPVRVVLILCLLCSRTVAYFSD